MRDTKCALVSLGCPKNQVDAEIMLGLLKEKGYQIITEEEKADILIVNTCGFIGPAKEESIDTILALAEYKKEGKCKGLVVTGCLTQRYRDELVKELPEVDAFLGTGDFPQIVEVVQKILAGEKAILVSPQPEFIYDHSVPRIHSGEISAYVKIAEGCDNCCTYCVIPQIRGRFRSRKMESIAKEVESLIEQGFKEIILVAQDTTRYGEDIYGKLMLPELLNKLCSITGQYWIRLLYCYPTRFTDELIEMIAKEEKICKYIEMPLQHIDEEIIKKMHRQGSRQEITRLLEKIRKRIPGVALRTSFIVGFPGETDEHFQNLLDFMQEIKFDRVGIFTYSQEEGTPAAQLPEQISEEIKQTRFHQAMQIQQGISLQKNQEWVGKNMDILVEGPSQDSPDLLVGRSQRDAPEIDGVVFIDKGHALRGEIIKVKIKRALEYDLIGEIE